jgi:thiol-disulfide isomerase/thioredoxin
MSPGLIALLAALAAALAGGAVWRGLNGRMRVVGVRNLPARADAALSGNEAIPAAASATPGHPGAVAGPVLSGERLGEPLGERATLVQFSSAFCAPCRATRRILADVAGMVGGVAHIEIDAESRLDLVRELGVLRTPTVLVLDADGRVARRASGQPRKADVIAALGQAMGVAAVGQAAAGQAAAGQAIADQAIADQATIS